MLFKNTVEESTFQLLSDISANASFNKFKLVGGTALSLQIGHRKSIDLDFFCTEPFDENEVEDQLRLLGKVDISNISKNTIQSYINEIKVDFLRHNFPDVGKVVRQENIRLASLEDIAAMKLNAINNRGAKKDFVDIFYLLNTLSLKDIVKYYDKKYGRNEFQILKSLIYFNDADTEPDPVFIKPVSWKQIKIKIQLELEQLLKE